LPKIKHPWLYGKKFEKEMKKKIEKKNLILKIFLLELFWFKKSPNQEIGLGRFWE
jgi:hypothetical protein